MGQEFFIKSSNLEDKVRQLLPSQGGLGAGFDLSASTQIIPIVDLTESAEGSDVRADLQTALSHNSITSFNIRNTASAIITSTGYFRVFGAYSTIGNNSSFFALSDGVTDKKVSDIVLDTSQFTAVNFDFIVFLSAGDQLKASSDSASGALIGCTRQIADIDGNLVNPL